MSRKMLITLIVVMIAVLSGLIFVQTTMIKSASDIREEQFNQLVKNALLFVSVQLNQLEEREARNSAQLQRMPIKPGISEGFDVFPRNNSEKVSLSFDLKITEKTQNSYIEKNYSIEIRDTTGLSNDSLAFEQLFQLQQEQRLKQWVRNLDWRNYKIILEDRPIYERVDSTNLQNLLKFAIAETGINIDYKYAIKNSNLGRNKIVAGNADYEPGRRKEFAQALFRSDTYGAKPNYLNIYFPKRSRYFLKQTGLSIIPTIILTALLIGIFVYTIMVIFRQKKLSNIKNDFINNMTHELKTPISTISLASQMLQDGSVTNTPTMINHVSNIINQESKRLSFQVEKASESYKRVFVGGSETSD